MSRGGIRAAAERVVSGRSPWWRHGGLAALLLALVACSQPSPPTSQTPSGDRPAAQRPEPALPDRPSATRQAPARPAPDAVPQPGDRASAPARWRVDLERDERRGGHTIARHVGRSDAQLRARLSRESIAAASTYPDLDTAEQTVERALAANERRVLRWLDQRGSRPNLAIRYRARDGVPTGRLLRRGAAAAQEVTGAVVVLRWRNEDHYVLTSYPEEPR